MARLKDSALLRIDNLHVNIGDTAIVRGLSLHIKPGEIHAIMGPNGSGKSTLASTLMGHPAYSVTKGSARFAGENLLAMETDKRARVGLFLAFQYPKEIAGVTLRSFLFSAVCAQRKERNPELPKLSPVKFQKTLTETMQSLHMDPAFAERAINKGFSGGEKKKAEILQMTLLAPRLALLDETDSGLDVDALRIVAEGVNRMRGPDFSAIIVTHYARLLEYIVPDHVHVMIKGNIVESGDATLAHTLEKEGYAKYGVREKITLDQ